MTLPLDFGARKAVTNGAGQVEHQRLDIQRVAQAVFQGQYGFLLARAGLPGRRQMPIQLGQRHAPLGHLGIEMRVPLFHILE